LHQNVSSTTGSRETPPPLRFLGRRVYLAAIVVLIAMSPDPDWRTRSGRSRRSLHDRALAPLVTRHVHGNAILPDGARRLHAAGRARFSTIRIRLVAVLHFGFESAA